MKNQNSILNAGVLIILLDEMSEIILWLQEEKN